MANTDVYVNKVTVPKGDGNTYTGILVDTASQKTWYGTSSTGATTQAKVVTCSGYYLQTGAIISVAFSTANTYTSAKITLNVNSTGAKDVYYNNAVTSSTNTLKWDAGEQVTFIYNGTGYYFVTKSKVVSSVPQLNWYGDCSTTSSTAEKAVTSSAYTLNNYNIIVIGFNSANPSYGSQNITLNVNSTGAKQVIYNGDYASSTNPLLWESGDRLAFMYLSNYYVFLFRVVDVSPLTIRTWS